MGSGKEVPCTFQLEGVRVPSSTEAMASQMDISSTTTSEDDKTREDDKTSEDDKTWDPNSPPDGGLFAWLQVLAGWILVLNSR
jgi:hypothetical protein